jgi:NADH-quinone oxidoreductase subunit L
VVVRPFVWLARINRGDVVDRVYDGIAEAGGAAHRLLSGLQTGAVRRYAAAIAAGSALLLAIALLT